MVRTARRSLKQRGFDPSLRQVLMMVVMFMGFGGMFTMWQSLADKHSDQARFSSGNSRQHRMNGNQGLGGSRQSPQDTAQLDFEASGSAPSGVRARSAYSDDTRPHQRSASSRDDHESEDNDLEPELDEWVRLMDGEAVGLEPGSLGTGMSGEVGPDGAICTPWLSFDPVSSSCVFVADKICLSRRIMSKYQESPADLITHQVAWMVCFNACEAKVAPVWDIVKSLNVDTNFEDCHCTCYSLAMVYIGRRDGGGVYSISPEFVTNMEAVSTERLAAANYPTVLTKTQKERNSFVFELARRAADTELSVRPSNVRSQQRRSGEGRGRANGYWSGEQNDEDPCEIGYVLFPHRTFWAGGCSWGTGRCGKRTHPGWIAGALSRGLVMKSFKTRADADFYRDYLARSNTLEGLGTAIAEPIDLEPLRFVRSGMKGPNTSLPLAPAHHMLARPSPAGVHVRPAWSLSSLEFAISRFGRSGKWVFQYWHKKLNIFHSKTLFSMYTEGVTYIPQTFQLPESVDTAIATMKACANCSWIYKRAFGSGGYGVRLIDLKELQGRRDAIALGNRKAIIQRSVESLLIDDGRKFDIRVYVVVPRWEPLMAWILPDALVRLAYEPYNKRHPEKNSLCATRTNTAQRKKCATEDEHKDKVTHNRTRMKSKYVWRLPALFDYIDKTFGAGKSKVIWQKIRDAIRHALIAVAVRYRPQTLETGSQNVHTLGVDIMIDEVLEPWIIEMNMRPDDNSYCSKSVSPFLQGVPVATFARRVVELLGYPRYFRGRYCDEIADVKIFCKTRPAHGECTNDNLEDLFWYVDMMHSQPPHAVPVPPRYRDKTGESIASSPITSLALEPLLPSRGDLELWEKYKAKYGIKSTTHSDGVRRSDRLLLEFVEWRYIRQMLKEEDVRL